MTHANKMTYKFFLLIRHQDVIESASISLWQKSRRCGGRKKIFGGGQFWWQAHQISPPDASQNPGLTASFSSSKNKPLMKCVGHLTSIIGQY
ncbi:hypothetical protein VTO58DRAFT_111372 [Aureobasidium pullulans]